MEGKKRPCEWSSAILEVLMEDYYFLENFGTQFGKSSEKYSERLRICLDPLLQNPGFLG